MLTDLVGHELGPDNPGRGVEGELDGDGGQLELPDGVGLRGEESAPNSGDKREHDTQVVLQAYH